MEHKRQYNIEKMLIAIAIFTSSFDVFGAINIFGYTFRISQFVMMPIIFFFLMNVLRKNKYIPPVGWKALLVFFLLQTLFVFRSPNLSNAIKYDIYLLFNILTVFSLCYYLNKAYSFNELLNIYINSFFFVAIFGLVQFILFMFGINLLVTQHWSTRLARINGFSYEPSYYATYMLMGFVLCAYLLEKNECNKIKHIWIKFGVISVSILLSTSRMGWLMVALWILFRFPRFIISFVQSKSKKRIMIGFSILIIMFFGIVGGIYYVKSNFENVKFLLNGLGIAGTSAHSSNDRINALKTCIEIWKRSPLIGYSFGGVDPLIKLELGEVYISGDNGSGNTIGELLVSSGIIGLVPLILYFKNILSKKKYFNLTNEQNNYYSALILSFAFEFIILCMNQNFLRVYVWMHIAIINCAVISFENSKEK